MSYDSPVIINIDYEVVNFYYGKIVDLCIGYIVSLIFYLIVVYHPEYEKKKQLKSRTIVIFGRLQTYLKRYLDMSVEAFEIKTDKYSNDTVKVWQSYFKNNRINIIKVLERETKYKVTNVIGDLDSDNASTYIEVMNVCARNIIYYKRELIPFIMYLTPQQMELYANLEEIFIFEQINRGLTQVAADALFVTNFDYILNCYIQVRKILGVRK